MTVQRRPLVAGNWKMNGLKPAAAELGKIVQGAAALPKVDLLVCPPATLVMMFASAAHGSHVAIGAQDCHAEPSGAFTGDISAEMLADAGGRCRGSRLHPRAADQAVCRDRGGNPYSLWRLGEAVECGRIAPRRQCRRHAGRRFELEG